MNGLEPLARTDLRLPDREALAEAARLIAAGRLVAFPTETVYGLGADATSERAVAAIFAAKQRPKFNPLIVHVADLLAAERLAVFDERARALAARFWPGPLTLVLPRRDDCPVALLASAGLDSLAVRVPGHPVALALLEACKRPLAAPSANISGGVSPTTAEHVIEGLYGSVALVLDGGPCPLGLESTVIDLTGETPRLLRPGGVTDEALREVLGTLAGAEAGTPKSPGQMESHYAPSHPLRLDATAVSSEEALLAFGPRPLTGAKVTVNLSEEDDLGEAAARFFAALRQLDKENVAAIAVMPIPDRGLGRAINDRLRRAAAPRALQPQAAALAPGRGRH